MVAGYRIDGLLGEGGMGAVYRATQLSLNRTVALKILSSQLGDDPSFRERFRREGQLQAVIDHQHIVTVFEAGQTEHGLFIAMRLVRGPNLKDEIVAGELDPRRAIRLLTQVAEALDAAHDVGLIHRDVKPQNILIAAQDHAYLADFGLMKAPDVDSLTQTGQFVGTIDYVSPEQARGEGAGPRSDVYALAGVLYESLTGDIPFDRPSEAAILYAHMIDPPPKVSEHRSDLPEALDAVIQRGMAKDQDDRYPSAGELMREAAKAFGMQAGAVTAPAATVPAPDETVERPAAPAGDPEATRAGVAIPSPGEVTAPAKVPEPPTRAQRAAAPAPARDEPTRKRGLPASLIALAVALAALAVVGGLLAGRSGSGEGGTALPNSASAGNLGLSFPAGWKRVTAEPGIRGLDFADPIVLAPATPPGARLVAGSVNAGGPTLLPPSFLRLLPDQPARDDAVRLGRLEAYRYKALQPRGQEQPLTLYTSPTTSGVATVACVPGGGEGAAFLADCERVAGSLELAGAKPYPLGPSEQFARLLTRTFRSLDAASAAGSRRLRAARTPSAQASAAGDLSDAYASASRTLARAELSPADRPAGAALAAALDRTGDAYGRAAAAARRGDRGAYAAARRAVRRSGAATQRALRALEELGYTVSG